MATRKRTSGKPPARPSLKYPETVDLVAFLRDLADGIAPLVGDAHTVVRQCSDRLVALTHIARMGLKLSPAGVERLAQRWPEAMPALLIMAEVLQNDAVARRDDEWDPPIHVPPTSPEARKRAQRGELTDEQLVASGMRVVQDLKTSHTRKATR